MMSESTDDLPHEMEESSRDGDSGDNGTLRQSGFVLVSDSGSEVSNFRQSPPAVTSAPLVPNTTSLTGEFTNLSVASVASTSSTPPTASSREGSMSPRSNPYRGYLPHLQTGYSHSHQAVGHEHGHGHSHEHGHGHSHEHGHGHSHDSTAFFTPTAPASDAPLPPTLAPPAPLQSVAPPPGPPLPQYQLPQFARMQEAPTAAPMAMTSGQESFVGVGMGDEDAGVYHEGSRGGQGGGGGFFSNLFGSDLMHRVVEKTKSGMETVITTLDPGMKDYIMGGGDVNLVIASVDNVESTSIRDAFYTVFGKSTIRCLAAPTNLAPQLIGADAARTCCEERIKQVRSSGQAGPDSAVLAMANFLSEPTSNRWFVLEYLLLQDSQLECEAYSIALPVSADLVTALRASTPADFPGRWSGTLMTLDQLLQEQQKQQPAVVPDQTPTAEWRYSRFGLTRRDLIAQTARILARDYKQRIQAASGFAPSPAGSMAFAS